MRRNVCHQITRLEGQHPLKQPALPLTIFCKGVIPYPIPHDQTPLDQFCLQSSLSLPSLLTRLT